MKIARVGTLCAAVIALLTVAGQVVRAQDKVYPVPPTLRANEGWTQPMPWSELNNSGVYITMFRQKEASDGKYEWVWYFFNTNSEKAEISYQIIDTTDNPSANTKSALASLPKIADQEDTIGAGKKVGGQFSGNWAYYRDFRHSNVFVSKITIGDKVILDRDKVQ